jgi:outer membrane protein TolC
MRLQEADVLTATETLERRKELLAQGVIGPREVEEAERSLAAAKSKVLDTRRELAEADLLVKSAVDDAKNHHKQPYEKELLLRVLKLNALPESEIREAIEKRGVGFRLTPEDDAAFSSAGASRELLKLMRANYRLR